MIHPVRFLYYRLRCTFTEIATVAGVPAAMRCCIDHLDCGGDLPGPASQSRWWNIPSVTIDMTTTLHGILIAMRKTNVAIEHIFSYVSMIANASPNNAGLVYSIRPNAVLGPVDDYLFKYDRATGKVVDAPAGTRLYVVVIQRA